MLLTQRDNMAVHAGTAFGMRLLDDLAGLLPRIFAQLRTALLAVFDHDTEQVLDRLSLLLRVWL
jgi:hypothetical protein